MPVEDAEISTSPASSLKSGPEDHYRGQGHQGREGRQFHDRHVETKDGKVQTITADRLISAVGVQGNIENLGLEALGVKTDRGCIVIDGYGKTNVPGIYAIGDVAGPPMLAHKAEHEGVICIEKIAGLPNVHPMDKAQDPGLHLLQSAGRLRRSDRSQGQGTGPRHPRRPLFPSQRQWQGDCARRRPGLIKTIFDKKTGELLGAHMVGAEVTELIQGFVVAMNLETTEEELMHTIFPHPTLSEMMKESVLDAYGSVC
jgi:dihydrolipoamide dehydrogenase